MTRLKTPAGGFLTAPAGAKLTIPNFASAASFVTSWDALDAELYVPSAGEQAEYTGYAVSSTPRLAKLRGRGSAARPLLRDPGPFGQAYGRTLGLPGPAWIPSSRRFRGRPAVHFDQVHSTPLHAMLSPQSTLGDSADYFNPPDGYAAPYWLAMLCRLSTAPGGTVDSFLGSDRTISAGPTTGYGNQIGTGTDWSFACWYDPVGDDPTALIPDGVLRSGVTQSIDETVLIVEQITKGTDNALMAIYRRAASGVLVGSSAVGTVSINAPAAAWRELFFGWVGAHGYLSALGIGSGTASAGDISNLVAWASPWLPAAGSLPAEP